VRLPEVFENRDEILHIDGVSTLKLAEEFGTPLYVVSEKRVRRNFKNLYNTLNRNYRKIRIYYAAKANTNISILKILEDEGACIDAVSPGEVFIALKTGFTSQRILFTGTSVRNDELEFLVKSNVTINVDSLSQLNRLLKITLPKQLSVRINPEIGAGHHNHCITAGKDSKFGLWEDEALKAYKIASEAGIKHFGIHMHIGSGILASEPFISATRRLLEIAKKIHEQLNVDFEFIDIGGGIGVPYKPHEKELNLDLFSEAILRLFKDKIEEYGLGEPVFCMEPGRYIVCDAVCLLTTVNTIKSTPFRRFVGVDAGFNTLIRPAMYGSYHHILTADKLNRVDEEVYDVAGPLCESGDLLARDRKMSKIEEGRLLVILNAGAYGYSMSSQYNSRPKPSEILVKDGKYALIRERETIEDLSTNQRTAPWLK